MARRLRIQYEGALYHVINRGNFQRDVFDSAGAAKAFETVLGEACERHQWKIHAHVVMRNHYHLALETPLANLVEGMHWLQITYASRFNRFRRVSGHLFQGRYQALLVEDAGALLRVVNYIHLNPVKAKIVAAVDVGAFRWSSLRRFAKGPRPSWLVAEDILLQLGLSDTASSWTEYLQYLIRLASDPAEQERQQFSELERGWTIGTSAWRQALAREYSHHALDSGIPREELHEIKERRWWDALQAVLHDAGRTQADMVHEPKGAHWKIKIACELRRRYAAPHRWIAAQLNMGTPAAVRVNVARFS